MLVVLNFKVGFERRIAQISNLKIRQVLIISLTTPLKIIVIVFEIRSN